MRKSLIIFITFFILISLFSIGAFLINKNESTLRYRIAYMGSPVRSPFWDKLGHALIEAGNKKGVTIDDYTSYSGTREIKEILSERILKENYDAVIFGSGGESEFSYEFLKDLSELKIPVFEIDTKEYQNITKGFVVANNYESGKLVGEYISDKIRKDKKVLLITPNLFHENSLERKRGAIEVFENKDIEVNSIDMGSIAWETENISEAIDKEFEKDNNYGAIFAVWDLGIISAQNTIEKMEIDNIIYVGFDGIDFVLKEIYDGKISATIMQPVNFIAENSINQTINYLEGKEYENEIFISGFLVTKDNIEEYLLT